MSEDILISMQKELEKALEKPENERHWIMVIDLNKCIGCHACTIACVSENKLPPGVVYRPVLEEEFGNYPNVGRRFVPRPCMQCDNPPCTPVCPVNATRKNADGIVVVDYDRCIGCRYCIVACPYSARTSDFGEYYTKKTPAIQPYEQISNFEYEKKWERKDGKSPIGNARKCHYCIHRLNAGMLPACVTTCIARVNYFGDKNDPESMVSRLIANPRVMRLKEEKGTNPQVFYLL